MLCKSGRDISDAISNSSSITRLQGIDDVSSYLDGPKSTPMALCPMAPIRSIWCLLSEMYGWCDMRTCGNRAKVRTHYARGHSTTG